MARALNVFLYNRLAGALVQEDSGQLCFRYAPDYLKSAGAEPLSQSLPLRAEPYDHRATRPFFAGLLPEEESRDLVARALGVSARNDYAILERIGGECAGAVSFRHPGEIPADTELGKVSYRYLSAEALVRILDILPDRPLLAGDAGVRLSLAGARDNLPVFVADGEIALPLGESPSSHVLKPPIPRVLDTVVNEAYCLALAHKAGLDAVGADIRAPLGREFLLVERYDRRREAGCAAKRLHREDFCQALGIPPECKYQAAGGPTLTRCFDLVRRATARPAKELHRLLLGVLFNFLIGNNDAHGKNYALLYGPLGAELAPLYDVSSTEVYEGLSRRLAMKIGGAGDFDEIYPRHWERFAREAGLSAPQTKRKLLDLARALPSMARALLDDFETQGHHSAVIHRIAALIEDRCRQTLERFDMA